MSQTLAKMSQTLGSDRLGMQFAGGGGEFCGEGSYFFGEFWVGEGAVVGDGLVGFGDGDLVGQDDDADVAEDGSDVNEAAESAEGTGGGAEQGGDFAFECDERGIALAGSGEPVDGVLEDGGDGAVVFGAGHQQRVVRFHEVEKLGGGFGGALGCFEVLVEEGHGIIPQIDDGHFGSGVAGFLGSEADEFFVEGIFAGASGEGEDARHDISRVNEVSPRGHVIAVARGVARRRAKST